LKTQRAFGLQIRTSIRSIALMRDCTRLARLELKRNLRRFKPTTSFKFRGCVPVDEALDVGALGLLRLGRT
jgi:hypothetical protein